MNEVGQQKAVEVQYKKKITNYKLPQNADELVQVTLEDGSCITTDLIVSTHVIMYFIS